MKHFLASYCLVDICRLPPKVSKYSNLAVNLEKIVASGTGENLKIPPKQTILRNLAVNGALLGFVSPRESFRLPPKVSKYSNLAVNSVKSYIVCKFKTCIISAVPKLRLVVSTDRLQYV